MSKTKFSPSQTWPIGPKLRKSINIDFLFTFTYELIINSSPEQFLKKDIKQQKILRKKTKIPLKYPKIIIKPKPIQREFILPKQKMIKEMKIMGPIQQPSQFQESIIHEKKTKKEEVMPKETINIVGLDLGKINPFIDDPSVSYIECSGENKFILINKSGKNQITKISLDENEINNIIKECSKKSNTPIDPNSPVFQAKLDNLLITAICSDVIGSRFAIEKTK